MDYRELRGEHFDAIASIGMVEHVGAANIDAYARGLAGLLEPGRAAAQPRHRAAESWRRRGGPVLRALRLPRRRPAAPVAHPLALEGAGFETDHVEGYREHYDRTLTHWANNLDANLPRAEQIAGPERLRVWRLYLRAARSGFRTGFTSIYQVRAVRT